MILVLNLKMNLTKNSVIKYEKLIHDKEVIVLPQYPYLLFFRNGSYSLGSQDVSKFSKGSYTGEVCAKGLKGLGVKYVLVGHYERKEYLKEDVNDFRSKITNVIENEMIPIYCVSMNEEEYLNDKELLCIENQLEGIPDYTKYIMIAYEPSFMIGKDEINIDYEHTNKVLIKIKEYLMERNINHSILYGGGINEDNVQQLKYLNPVDGYVMSSSALDEEKFEYIYNEINK